MLITSLKFNDFSENQLQSDDASSYKFYVSSYTIRKLLQNNKRYKVK